MKFKYRLFTWASGAISRLPFGFLYALSGFIAFLLNRVVGYRKKVVRDNLANSFPDIAQKEIKKIIPAFYRNLVDVSLETFKMNTLSKDELRQRVQLKGENPLLKHLADKRNVVMVMSHMGNWEWVSQRLGFHVLEYEYVGIIAKEMSDKFMDEFFTDLRKFHSRGSVVEVIPFAQTSRHVAANRKKHSVIVTIADQSPHKDEIHYRTTFLNQDTGVFLGPERIAKSLDSVVLFCSVIRLRRGYYEIWIDYVAENPKDMEPYFITNRHLQLLEKNIAQQPESWLWSHRRWKY
jgi:KDO2-lipid IV(A) lauroyltransferase